MVCIFYIFGFLCLRPLREILKFMLPRPPPPPGPATPPPTWSAAPSVRLASRVERIQPRTDNTRNTEYYNINLISTVHDIKSS